MESPHWNACAEYFRNQFASCQTCQFGHNSPEELKFHLVTVHYPQEALSSFGDGLTCQKCAFVIQPQIESEVYHCINLHMTMHLEDIVSRDAKCFLTVAMETDANSYRNKETWGFGDSMECEETPNTRESPVVTDEMSEYVCKKVLKRKKNSMYVWQDFHDFLRKEFPDCKTCQKDFSKASRLKYHVASCHYGKKSLEIFGDGNICAKCMTYIVPQEVYQRTYGHTESIKYKQNHIVKRHFEEIIPAEVGTYHQKPSMKEDGITPSQPKAGVNASFDAVKSVMLDSLWQKCEQFMKEEYPRCLTCQNGHDRPSHMLDHAVRAHYAKEAIRGFGMKNVCGICKKYTLPQKATRDENKFAQSYFIKRHMKKHVLQILPERARSCFQKALRTKVLLSETKIQAKRPEQPNALPSTETDAPVTIKLENAIETTNISKDASSIEAANEVCDAKDIPLAQNRTKKEVCDITSTPFIQNETEYEVRNSKYGPSIKNEATIEDFPAVNLLSVKTENADGSCGPQDVPVIQNDTENVLLDETSIQQCVRFFKSEYPNCRVCHIGFKSQNSMVDHLVMTHCWWKADELFGSEDTCAVCQKYKLPPGKAGRADNLKRCINIRKHMQSHLLHILPERVKPIFETMLPGENINTFKNFSVNRSLLVKEPVKSEPQTDTLVCQDVTICKPSNNNSDGKKSLLGTALEECQDFFRETYPKCPSCQAGHKSIATLRHHLASTHYGRATLELFGQGHVCPICDQVVLRKESKFNDREENNETIQKHMTEHLENIVLGKAKAVLQHATDAVSAKDEYASSANVGDGTDKSVERKSSIANGVTNVSIKHERITVVTTPKKIRTEQFSNAKSRSHMYKQICLELEEHFRKSFPSCQACNVGHKNSGVMKKHVAFKHNRDIALRMFGKSGSCSICEKAVPVPRESRLQNQYIIYHMSVHLEMFIPDEKARRLLKKAKMVFKKSKTKHLTGPQMEASDMNQLEVAKIQSDQKQISPFSCNAEPLSPDSIGGQLKQGSISSNNTSCQNDNSEKMQDGKVSQNEQSPVFPIDNVDTMKLSSEASIVLDKEQTISDAGKDAPSDEGESVGTAKTKLNEPLQSNNSNIEDQHQRLPSKTSSKNLPIASPDWRRCKKLFRTMFPSCNNCRKGHKAPYKMKYHIAYHHYPDRAQTHFGNGLTCSICKNFSVPADSRQWQQIHKIKRHMASHLEELVPDEKARELLRACFAHKNQSKEIRLTQKMVGLKPNLNMMQSNASEQESDNCGANTLTVDSHYEIELENSRSGESLTSSQNEYLFNDESSNVQTIQTSEKGPLGDEYLVNGEAKKPESKDNIPTNTGLDDNISSGKDTNLQNVLNLSLDIQNDISRVSTEFCASNSPKKEPFEPLVLIKEEDQEIEFGTETASDGFENDGHNVNSWSNKNPESQCPEKTPSLQKDKPLVNEEEERNLCPDYDWKECEDYFKKAYPSCKKCSSGFNRADYMTRHVARIHYGEKILTLYGRDVKCPFCDLKVTTKKARIIEQHQRMKAHIGSRHLELLVPDEAKELLLKVNVGSSHTKQNILEVSKSRQPESESESISVAQCEEQSPKPESYTEPNEVHIATSIPYSSDVATKPSLPIKNDQETLDLVSDANKDDFPKTNPPPVLHPQDSVIKQDDIEVHDGKKYLEYFYETFGSECKTCSKRSYNLCYNLLQHLFLVHYNDVVPGVHGSTSRDCQLCHVRDVVPLVLGAKKSRQFYIVRHFVRFHSNFLIDALADSPMAQSGVAAAFMGCRRPSKIRKQTDYNSIKTNINVQETLSLASKPNKLSTNLDSLTQSSAVGDKDRKLKAKKGQMYLDYFYEAFGAECKTCQNRSYRLGSEMLRHLFHIHYSDRIPGLKDITTRDCALCHMKDIVPENISNKISRPACIVKHFTRNHSEFLIGSLADSPMAQGGVAAAFEIHHRLSRWNKPANWASIKVPEQESSLEDIIKNIPPKSWRQQITKFDEDANDEIDQDPVLPLDCDNDEAKAFWLDDDYYDYET